jgi:ureidoglycolate lyase
VIVDRGGPQPNCDEIPLDDAWALEFEPACASAT